VSQPEEPSAPRASARRRRFSPLPGVLGPRPDHRAVQTFGGSHAGLGIKYAGTIVGFTLIGLWLDTKLGTRPWLLLAGIFLGLAGGFYSLVMAVRGDRPASPEDDA
jgi:hypothetical protein